MIHHHHCRHHKIFGPNIIINIIITIIVIMVMEQELADTNETLSDQTCTNQVTIHAKNV